MLALEKEAKMLHDEIGKLQLRPEPANSDHDSDLDPEVIFQNFEERMRKMKASTPALPPESVPRPIPIPRPVPNPLPQPIPRPLPVPRPEPVSQPEPAPQTPLPIPVKDDRWVEVWGSAYANSRPSAFNSSHVSTTTAVWHS